MYPRLTIIFTAAISLAVGVAIGLVAAKRGRGDVVPTASSNPAPAHFQIQTATANHRVPTNSSSIAALDHLRFLATSPGNLILAPSLATIAKLSLEECREAAALFTTYPEHERNVLWKAIARRWVQLDPDHAFRTAVREHHNVIREVLGPIAAEGIVARDPEAALREISAANGKYNKLVIANWVTSPLARVDPRGAAQFLASEKIFNGNEYLYRAVTREYVRAFPEEAFQWTRSLPTEQLRREAAQEAWRAWSDADPSAAAAALNNSTEVKNNRELYGHLASSWSSKDPMAALAWIQSLAEGPQKETALRSLRLDIRQVSPGQAREIIESLSPGMQNHFAWQVATQIAREEVKDALSWIESLSGEEARAQALNKIMEVWSANEPGQAAAYMAALPESKARTELIKRAASLWSAMEPEAALDWAKQLPSSRDRDEALSEVAQAIREEDPQTALATLSMISDESARGRIVRKVLESYARVDGPGAAEWALSLPEKMQPDAMSGVVRAWGPENQNVTGNWLKSLPPGEARDSAIQAYVSVIDGTDAGMATQWAAAIDDHVKRTESLVESFHRWAQENPPAAGEWLESAELADGLRPFFDKFLEEAKSRKANRDR